MSKRYFIVIAAIFTIALFTGFSLITSVTRSAQDEKPVFPENVNAVFQRACIGCHSTESMNDKAKDKLDLAKWEEYSTISKISKLNEIGKVVSEGAMPPAKFLERFPDKKLTEEEAKILADWSRQEAGNLVK